MWQGLPGKFQKYFPSEFCVFLTWKFRVVMTKLCFTPPEIKKQLPKLWRPGDFNFVSNMLSHDGFMYKTLIK